MYANEWGNHLDSKYSFVPQGEHRLGFDGFFAHYGFHHEYVGDSNYYHLDTDENIFNDQYEPDALTDMAMERITKLSSDDQSFSLFLSLGTPHDPWEEWNVPREYLDLVKDRDFYLPKNYLSENDAHADAWARLNENERAELTNWMRVYTAMTANLDENIGRVNKDNPELAIY
jgi:arylsulfatase A-like enzyme